MVETVRGPVDAADLGTTLMHEHVFVLTPDLLANYGHEYWDEELRVADAVDKLTRLRALGVRTIVDPTVVGLGRYIPRVARVNAEVDITIVAATGLYTFDELPRQIQSRGPGSLLGGEEPLTGMFLRDIREGIGGTEVKAGLLKGVVEEKGLTPDQQRIHRAIAATHRETGVPITVHTNSEHRTGHLALDFYEAEGVDLTKVVVGHAGDSNDLDYLRALADRGAVLGCDRFGNDRYNTTDRRVAAVAALCAQGYADRIVLSHDASCYIDFYAGEQAQRTLYAMTPNWHYEHIPRDVLPALREAGVGEDQITTMMVDNPRRYFGG
jgi:phosphotriesterase-related protein